MAAIQVIVLIGFAFPPGSIQHRLYSGPVGGGCGAADDCPAATVSHDVTAIGEGLLNSASMADLHRIPIRADGVACTRVHAPSRATERCGRSFGRAAGAITSSLIAAIAVAVAAPTAIAITPAVPTTTSSSIPIPTSTPATISIASTIAVATTITIAILRRGVSTLHDQSCSADSDPRGPNDAGQRGPANPDHELSSRYHLEISLLPSNHSTCPVIKRMYSRLRFSSSFLVRRA